MKPAEHKLETTIEKIMIVAIKNNPMQFYFLVSVIFSAPTLTSNTEIVVSNHRAPTSLIPFSLEAFYKNGPSTREYSNPHTDSKKHYLADPNQKSPASNIIQKPIEVSPQGSQQQQLSGSQRRAANRLLDKSQRCIYNV